MPESLSPSWGIVTAIATAVMALIAIVAVYLKRRPSRLAAAAQQATFRPLLTHPPERPGLSMPHHGLDQPYRDHLHNIGKGEAILLRVALRYEGVQVAETLERHVLVPGVPFLLPDLNVLLQRAVSQWYGLAAKKVRESGNSEGGVPAGDPTPMSVHVSYADTFGNEYCQDFEEFDRLWLKPGQCHLTKTLQGPLLLLLRQGGRYLLCILLALWGRRTKMDELFPPVTPGGRDINRE